MRLLLKAFALAIGLLICSALMVLVLIGATSLLAYITGWKQFYCSMVILVVWVVGVTIYPCYIFLRWKEKGDPNVESHR